MQSDHQKTVKGLLALDEKMFGDNPQALIKQKEKQMNDAAKDLDFETAAILRDEIATLEMKFGKIQKAEKKIKTAEEKLTRVRKLRDIKR